MLIDSDFVHVYSFDFWKAFDMVQHATLTCKLAQLELPDSIYNWAVNFFENHAHCTKYVGQVSAVAVIQACIIQGSAIQPTSYVVTSDNLHPVHDRNQIFNSRMTHIWSCRGSMHTRAKKRLTIYKRGLLTTT